jgi:hypothetical protein
MIAEAAATTPQIAITLAIDFPNAGVAQPTAH